MVGRLTYIFHASPPTALYPPKIAPSQGCVGVVRLAGQAARGGYGAAGANRRDSIANRSLMSH